MHFEREKTKVQAQGNRQGVSKLALVILATRPPVWGLTRRAGYISKLTTSAALSISVEANAAAAFALWLADVEANATAGAQRKDKGERRALALVPG